MKDFIIAALPWILAGLLFAVVAASKINKVRKCRKSGTEQPQAGQESDEKKEADNYGLIGMCIGMCFGLLLDNLGVFSGFGMCIGMALGLLIGTCIKKDGEK